MKRSKSYGIGLLFFNRRILLAFEILYNLLAVTITVPLFFGFVRLVMRLSGYRYLTMENLRSFFYHPVVYLGLALLVLLSAIHMSMEMSAVIYILHCAREKYHPSLHEVAFFSLANTWMLRKKGRRPFLWIALLYLPLFNAGNVPELLAVFSFPNLLVMDLPRQYLTAGAFLLPWLLLSFPFFWLLYAFHGYTIGNLDSRQAAAMSRTLVPWKVKVRDGMWLIAVQGASYGLYLLFLGGGISAVVVISRVFVRSYLLSTFMVSALRTVMVVLITVFSFLGTPIGTIVVTLRFYRHVRDDALTPCLERLEEQKGLKKRKSGKEQRRMQRRVTLAVQAILLSLAIYACGSYLYRMHRGEFNLQVEYLGTMEVTAHRGASRFFPENTMAAFQGAIDAGADWIELDVHESSDGQIFVMHDDSFKRTTGLSAMAWMMTYDEISTLDAGSFFSGAYKGEGIPLLSQVIALAKENDIRLNIEIKPAKEEADLEERLVQLLWEEDFVERCVITSQNYDSIVKVKRIDPNITTVYVMGFAYGNIDRLVYADAFSVNAGSVTQALVERVHRAGKQIYAWTVNTRDTIGLMIDYQVDNIITDDVPLAKTCIARRMSSDAVNTLVDYLSRQMRAKRFRY